MYVCVCVCLSQTCIFARVRSVTKVTGARADKPNGEQINDELLKCWMHDKQRERERQRERENATERQMFEERQGVSCTKLRLFDKGTLSLHHKQM